MATTHTDNLSERYQRFHDENIHYQTNNWLVEDLPILLQARAGTITEIGCGNGRFLERACEHFDSVIATDFARSPVLTSILESHPTIRFHLADITQPSALETIRTDLCASADVLEHLLPESLDDTIHAINAIAPVQWHTIACYEADWTHPSVFTPDQWLDRFRDIDPSYMIARLTNRRGRDTQPVVTITRGFAFRLS
ncbi:MAG: methyltransferase domain-containing protein [Phycisphaerales bacterium JB043]